ncbi:MAG TPA: malate synthase A [Patescibacteria group bacterium]|nr:malate synthase A [Patescibacteria group bacterium]
MQIKITGPITTPDQKAILSDEAIGFLAKLDAKFEARRQELLQRRSRRLRSIREGNLPAFLPETQSVREAEWKVAPIPKDLLDRRVEITGPTDRKMIINALNSGSKVFMADFEDSNSPTWKNLVEGQVNLRDAVRRTISFRSPAGKAYELAAKTATLMVRPRGWHLNEKHFLAGGRPISGSLFDFGLFFFHNAKELIGRGTGPYFYLPKMESHLEARLWNDVFNFSEEELGVPRGTIRATVLIETILAAFEMDEILYELREHSAGLNCGRWDYIFSFIKTFCHRPDFVMPDRALVTMDRHFLKSYVDLLIRTCHRREAHAMGGMAAQIPIKDNPAENEAALEKVRQDKLREVQAGHDGTWVAHPGLVPVAMEIFDQYMKEPNQLGRKREEVSVSAKDLLTIPTGDITEAGLRRNVDVGLRYLMSWLGGNGCVPIYHLMEDAATAEICRTQLWQWTHHNAKLKDGRTVTQELVRQAIREESERALKESREAEASDQNVKLAARIFEEMTAAEEFPTFLTLVAYEYID